MVFQFLVDLILIPLSLLAAFALRLGPDFSFEIYYSSIELNIYVLAAGFFAIAIFKPYRVRMKSFDMDGVIRIAAVAAALTVAAIVASYLVVLWAPRSVPLIFGVVFFFSSLLVRTAGMVALNLIIRRNSGSVPVAVYGAGAAGIQLVSALRQSAEVRPMVFVDDNSSLHSLIISGLKVCGVSNLRKLVADKKIARVLIAIPSLSNRRRDALLQSLSDLSCEVQIIPSYVDLISGSGVGVALNPVSADELLGRENVDLDIPEVARTFAGRNVLISGAGGSIGSELCRQIVHCRPAKLVLLEQSEFALYEIDRSLNNLSAQNKPEIVSCLGSVNDERRVRNVIAENEIDIVLHAAAYKHVPLLETNELQAIQNNIFGTKTLAEAAAEANVDKFILISTDKAVRPTNVMGATKRIAELIIQDLQVRSTHTKFAMVRFGNVLGSSGSVIPLFRHQIANGGPVTVTHPEVTRYFMTIPEAARLVLLAGSFSAGGDLFVLDMGEPVKIVDLAKRMIALSGREFDETGKNENAISINFIGMRLGEKLYEELLINDDSIQKTTPHPKIMLAKEEQLSDVELEGLLGKMKDILANDDPHGGRQILADYVSGFEPMRNVQQQSTDTE